MNTKPTDLMWTAKDVAEFCGLKSKVTVLRALRRGELTGHRLTARTIRFKQEDVMQWITRNTKLSTLAI